MLIKEFWEQYPHYNMGFTAQNPKTKTEKVVGLSMHLMYDCKKKRTYQEFFLNDDYYNQLHKALLDRKPHQFSMTINNNTFDVILILTENDIIGVCLNTKERIAFQKQISLIIR